VVKHEWSYTFTPPQLPSRHVAGRPLLFINKPESEKYKITYKQNATQWRVTCCLTRRTVSSGMWNRVIGRLIPEVSKDCSTSIFTAIQSSLTALTWSRRHQVPPKHQKLPTQRHGITSQHTRIFGYTAVVTGYIIRSDKLKWRKSQPGRMFEPTWHFLQHSSLISPSSAPFSISKGTRLKTVTWFTGWISESQTTSSYQSKMAKCIIFDAK